MFELYLCLFMPSDYIWLRRKKTLVSLLSLGEIHGFALSKEINQTVLFL